MKKIYKYEVKPYDKYIEVPNGSKIISASFQGNRLCIWVEVYNNMEDTFEKIKIKIHVIPTGDSLPDEEVEFVNTVFHENLVMHVYKGV